MKKRIIAIVFIVLIGFAVVWMIIAGSKPPVLKVGDPLPQIEYQDSVNTQKIICDSNRNALIIYFKQECPHCEYELELLDKNLSRFENTNLFLITSEKEIFKNKFLNKFLNLQKSKSVKFGIVKKENYKNKFGVMVAPVLFFINREGKVSAILKGESKLERILKELK